MRKAKAPDMYAYARCIDCEYRGQNGSAYCQIAMKQVLCMSRPCVFFQWKSENTLQEMCASYYWPNYDDYRDEIELRGVKLGM